jgi:predicted transcriptional regulator
LDACNEKSQCKRRQNIDHIDWYAIVTLATVEEKKKLLEDLLEKNKYDFVLLDTVADFLTDVNSIEQTAELSNWIRGLANRYEFTAILTIHSNPSQEGSNKARGHLGSELLRRSETVFKLEHDRSIDQRTLTTSFSLGKNRSADTAETYFTWDESKGMFVRVIDRRNSKKGRKGPDYDALARDLIGTEWKHTDLVKKIVESAGVGVRTAKTRIEELVDLGKMIKQTDGKYTVI